MWERVFLPENAPVEWQDRAILWNAVEDAERSKDSRLAREFVVALPRELNADQQIDLLTEYIKQQFVVDGMCADVGIHDPDPPGHNPHAHILLTIRPLDEQGKWQYKTEKEYLCIRDDEERGFTAAEFLHAQDEGWEKQYPYLVGKKKVYMTTTDGEVQGLKRASKHPKSTTYGRQNPITERWNSESQLILWRSAWADIVNLHLERVGSTERVDHRSHAERGLDEQPTIHEGVAARAMEKKGIISARCELNRQIKADNALLRELKDLVAMLLMELNRLHTCQQPTGSYPLVILAVMEWIRSHYHQPFSVSELAQHVNYQPDYLSGLFKRSTGVSIVQYTNQLRLRMAKALLTNYEITIKEAAYSCGFPDEKYFMRLFRREESMTPSQFRSLQVK